MTFSQELAKNQKHDTLGKIYLKRRKEEPVFRKHPWIFSGAIHRMDSELEDGDLVEVYSSREELLARGHYNNGSIAVRILTFDDEQIDILFWKKRLQNAYNYRQGTGLIQNPLTNCYRLIHAEGDGLPGLIIDIYNEVAVIQCHSVGMYRQRNLIVDALKEVYAGTLKTIYDKSNTTLPGEYASGLKNEYLFGSSEGRTTVLENGHKFLVNWESGQKTGFFLDQRYNRLRLADFSKGKKVLNTFCYTGGFSVYALGAGADLVHSVDVSKKAIDLTDENVAINNFDESKHQSYTADVMQFLKENTATYDVMIVDPPAFAKNIKKRHNAVQGYKRLNALALRQIKSGGFIFTFSCSQVVDKKLFYNTIVAAAIEAGRKVRVLQHLSQPEDHPVSLFHPEGSYLKGLVLYVE